jgi:hypothetical protein
VLTRIKFSSDEIREEFFLKVRRALNFHTWNELITYFELIKSSFDRYKGGIQTLPINLYERLSNLLTNEEKNYFEKRVLLLDSAWGQKKGGSTTFALHGYIFETGRKNAIVKSKERANKFDTRLTLSKNLAYFIGLFIGDGFTNHYARYYLTQLIGNSSEDLFYKHEIFPIINKLFNIRPQLRYEKKVNAIRINLYSKSLFLLITDRFRIPRGIKSHTVLIPAEILNANIDILLSCIAGIYDAECCVFFDKRKKYLEPYPRIDLHMVNPHILRQISEIFKKQNIKHSINGNFERILIYGKENILSFLKNVKIKNYKNLESLKRLI